MLDEASIDASRINHLPSSSLRPIPCSEDAMGCTVRTVKMDKAHLWNHSSRRHQSFPQKTLSSSAWLMDTSPRTCVPAITAHHTSAQCWEQGQAFTELLHIVAPVRPLPQHREPASWGISSTNTINKYVAHGKCIFYVRTNSISATNLHKYTGKRITCHESTLYYK